MGSNILRGKIVENGYTIQQLAQKIGISKSAFYRRVNDTDRFTIGEANRIKDVLKLTNEEICQIFIN